MSQYLRFPEIKKITGLSRSTIFRLERAGNFPQRKVISPKAVGWLSDQVEGWVRSRQTANCSTSNPQHNSAK